MSFSTYAEYAPALSTSTLTELFSTLAELEPLLSAVRGLGFRFVIIRQTMQCNRLFSYTY